MRVMRVMRVMWVDGGSRRGQSDEVCVEPIGRSARSRSARFFGG